MLQRNENFDFQGCVYCVCVRERESVRVGCLLIGEKIRNFFSNFILLVSRIEQYILRLNKFGEDVVLRFGKKLKWVYQVNKELLVKQKLILNIEKFVK